MQQVSLGCSSLSVAPDPCMASGSGVHVGLPPVICTQIKLSIFPVLVINTEEMSGGPSATEAVKSNSCHNVNHKASKGIFDLMLILCPFSLILGETGCFSFVSNMLVSSRQTELRKMDQGRLPQGRLPQGRLRQGLPHPMEDTIQVTGCFGIYAFQNVHCRAS